MNRKIFLLAAVASLLVVRSASADINYSYVGVVQGTVTGGTTVTVNMYLQEVVTGSSTSLIASEGGLYAGAVAIAQTAGSGTTISACAVNSATEPNGFTGNNSTWIYNNGVKTAGGLQNSSSTSSQSNQATIVGITNNSANIPPGPSGTTAGGSVTTSGGTTTTLVFLGTVSIGVGATADATFTVTSLKNAASGTFDQNSFGNTLTATNGYDLDPNSTNPPYTGAVSNNTTFTIQTTQGTPEPSSMALCGLAVAGMGAGYWRRRKAKLAAMAAEQMQTPAIA